MNPWDFQVKSFESFGELLQAVRHLRSSLAMRKSQAGGGQDGKTVEDLFEACSQAERTLKLYLFCIREGKRKKELSPSVVSESFASLTQIYHAMPEEEKKKVHLVHMAEDFETSVAALLDDPYAVRQGARELQLSHSELFDKLSES